MELPMKTYMDFITDLSSNINLLKELEANLPFTDLDGLQLWFVQQGYQLAPGDVEMLYASQSSLMDNAEQINY
jgi:hypothetical protein